MPACFSILAVGEVNVDLVFSGIPRLPEFGAEVIADGLSRHLGGCTGNFAVFCARLGDPVALVSRVGRDDFGSFLLGELARYGVATSFVATDDNLPTGLTVSLSGPSDRAFVTYLGTIDSVQATDVPGDLLSRCRHLHVGSFFMQSRLRAGLRGLFELAHAAGLTVSLDTGYDPAQRWDGGVHDLLPLVDIFLPNEVEAAHLSGETDSAAGARALAREARLVVVKVGAAGAVAARNDELVAVPGFEVDVVDTTCCGDAFNAGFLHAWLTGADLPDAMRSGNAAGAIIATGAGSAAGLLSPGALRRRLDAAAES